MIEKELLNDFYEEIYDEFGEEILVRIHQLYSGLTLTVPKKLYHPNKVANKIQQNSQPYTKKELRDLARHYDYSERQLYRLLSKNNNKI